MGNVNAESVRPKEFPYDDFEGVHIQACFLCLKVIRPGRMTFWVGEKQIFMHPECASRFAAHLLKDSVDNQSHDEDYSKYEYEEEVGL